VIGERPARIACGSISLEAALDVPPGPGSHPGAVVCHPHPLYGGTMDNNVVRGVSDALLRGGFAVLRFNFRGVGGSGGEHGDGRAEAEDVAAALAHLADVPAVDASRLALVGYSFGAAVGLPVGAADSRVQALAAVAPPLAILPLNDLAGCAKPKLAVAGSADAYCPARAFERWYEGLGAPRKCVILPGADHFLVGREGEVGRAVVDFFRRQGLAPGETA